MSFFKSIKNTVKSGFGEAEDVFQGAIHSHTHLNAECHRLHRHERDNRFLSFAPPRTGNDVKWFVDGCGYMWAVSVAIEEAKESIWILDWWLSPELYLRRPPSANEQYRLDRMLLAAAERGVKVNVIVYKEVSNVLTRLFPCPLPSHLTDMTSMLQAHQRGPRTAPQHRRLPAPRPHTQWAGT